MSLINWRTINIDALDPDSPANFDLSTLAPGVTPVSTADVQSIGQQVRQLLRGGDSEGALRGALETAPYGADDKGKEIHLQTVLETLQGIRAAEMTPLLQRIYASEGGPEVLDTLMKYLYKGMSTAGAHAASSKGLSPNPTGFSQMAGRSFGGAEGGGQMMSVLLSWHEKVVEVAGVGSVIRVMTDRRTV
ncbi:hypothetical protein, variant [Verruconis gallopava]|uniref:Actin-related protein 2/3 complex subunit 5 n=1 Tax=Verruconis gallopava TaxID=253628 RepID=A0A0D1Z0I5_9PEZI|nr:uncharacterized protein PV09_02906 [Verruconis gallopava]XP_016216336.1 hypothetical protein, variant [Verruconis gallopava]KIW06466.1 hypothetical protein PV09_02906 [Verruconis gallopava]KIW06467.1 hypothetical protein, variant [Verruconis gallopava]